MAIIAEFDRVNHTTTISIVGQFTYDQNRLFSEIYKELLPSATDQTVIVDLSKTNYMDSAGLGMLLLFKQRMGNKVRDIAIHGANETVKSVLQVAQFGKMFSIK